MRDKSFECNFGIEFSVITAAEIFTFFAYIFERARRVTAILRDYRAGAVPDKSRNGPNF